MFFSIVIAILILSFLIISHEFGHFIVAKKLGIKVEEFGLGYPPKIWGIQKGETLYSINAIPFGGFVRLYGEEEKDEEHIKNPRSFNAKPAGARALTILGGVIMNFLTAVVIFYFLLPFNGFSNKQYLIFDYHFPFGQEEDFSVISFVAKDSPAEKAGLAANKIILSGNGLGLENSKQVINFVNNNKGKEISLKVKDLENGKVKNISLVPRLNPPEGEGAIGIGLGNMAVVQYQGFWQKSTVGFLHSFNLAHYSLTALGHLIKTSFQESSLKPLSSGVMGPVGILAITELSLKQGALAVFNLMALIALALAITNILPFPALDGGRLLFIIIEGISRKRIPSVVENKINIAGFAILIVLLVLVTVKDISRFKGIFF